MIRRLLAKPVQKRTDRASSVVKLPRSHLRCDGGIARLSSRRRPC
jgi:hypothetical protein